MKKEKPNRFLAVGFFVSLMLLLPTVTSAGAEEDYQQAMAEYQEKMSAKDYKAARKAADRMRELAEGPLRGSWDKLPLAVRYQARTLQAQGRGESALKLYERVLKIYQTKDGPLRPSVRVSHLDLGDVHRGLSRYAEAEQHYREALRIAEESSGPESQDAGFCLWKLGLLFQDMRRDDAAAEMLERSLKIDIQVLGPEHADVAITAYRLGNVYRKLRRFDDAVVAYQQALEVREKLRGGEHADVARTLNTLAHVHCDRGRYAVAEPLYQRALAIRERVLGSEHPDTAISLNNLAELYRAQGRYAEAEPLQQRALAIFEKVRGSEHTDTALSLNNLAALYDDQGRYAEAEPLYQRALAIKEKVLGSEHPDTALGLNNLAALYDDQGRYAEAEPLYQRALAVKEKLLGSEHPDTALSLNNLAYLYKAQGRYAEAEPLCQRALAIFEKVRGSEHTDTALSLNNLAALYDDQGRYAEAEPLYQRALAIRKKVLGSEHPDTALSLNNLAYLYNAQGRYAEAEPLYERALAIREKVLGSEHPSSAASLNNLAALYKVQGRYAEAEAIYQRALAIREKVLGSEHPDTATSLNNLALLYVAQGRYAKAEPLNERALAIREKLLGSEHPDTASSLNNLAFLYDSQGRYADAEPLYQRALAIREKVLGSEHPDTALSLNNLASLYDSQGRYADAEPLFQRALAIREKVLGSEHPDTALSLNNLAALYDDQGRYAEAEPLYQRALAIHKKVLGSEHPDTALSLNNLGWFYLQDDRTSEAEAMADRAIRILERSRVKPDLLLLCYKLRAKAGWQAGRRREAIADLNRALDLAEQLRGQVSGSARERAQFFSQFADEFEMMVRWQMELNEVSEVLTAIERGRARSLLDDMNLEGVDLQLGRPALEREQLRRQELELTSRIASLQHQLDQLGPVPGDTDSDAEKRKQLQQSLAHSRGELYQHHRDKLSSNPIYRNLLSVGAAPPRLSQLQRDVVKSDALLLVYLLGQEGGYLVSIDANQGTATELTIDAAGAAVLGIDAGPLTANRLRDALVNEQQTGAVQLLSRPTLEPKAVEKLHALYQVLLPDAARAAIASGQVKRLLIVPSGPLALLPFEPLVVEVGKQPKYLLDVGPPILYGPSATVLYNVMSRRDGAAAAASEPVLTVGNPSYDGQPADEDESILQQLSARSRYGAAGGRLKALPYTDLESEWVADAFQKANISSVRLHAGTATEANVRQQVAGRRLVHLASHGLVDQAYGNFFGALALTPGDAADNAANDGFLTLPEIYELDLKGCELAILSACETNYGPEQKGEGVWALSRGFLVAGSRRVVASNWLVDDEAAANLISVFCGGVAQAEEQGDQVDYAIELHKAKQLVRNQAKWNSPYYWGTFVLVGPQ